MESIIFDIMILNASSSHDLKIDNNMISDELIFRKHDIDSTQFYDSELYYSLNPRIHFKIYSNVKKRIQKFIWFTTLRTMLLMYSNLLQR